MNKPMPLVSVIIPVYNVERYLRECVNSVLQQTYTNIEIILVDDGSTDRSGMICDEYEGRDARIAVIHKANGGLSDARNEGLEICKGEYIAFLDSDDYISCIFLEIMMRTIINGECDIAVITGGTEFWDDGTSGPKLTETDGECIVRYVKAIEALEMMLYQKIATGAPFKICKRELFDAIRFPSGYLYEDVATTYKLLLEADKVAVIQGDLYAYRKRADSIIRQRFNEKKLIAMDIFDQLVTDENLIQAGLYSAACSRAYAMLYSVFLQIPANRRDTKKRVWKKLKTIRKVIICDRSKIMRRKNKYASLVSLLGMDVSYCIGKKCGQKGSMK